MSPGTLLAGFYRWMHKQTQSGKGQGANVRNVFVLRTHVLNSYVHSTFMRMQQQLGAENVFLLFDETNGPAGVPAVKWNDEMGVANGPAVITINEKDCQQINRLHLQGADGGSMHRVEAHVHACYTAIRRPYDYLWFVEYDVYCRHYPTLVQACNGIAADMLTGGGRKHRLLTVANKPRWHWWHCLLGEMAATPISQRRGCFFPVNRFSVPFLRLLEQNLSKSSGYCEVYFPTLCHLNGLTVKLIPRWLFGTFRYQPAIDATKIKRLPKNDFRLYHPVKQL